MIPPVFLNSPRGPLTWWDDPTTCQLAGGRPARGGTFRLREFIARGWRNLAGGVDDPTTWLGQLLAGHRQLALFNPYCRSRRHSDGLAPWCRRDSQVVG